MPPRCYHGVITYIATNGPPNKGLNLTRNGEWLTAAVRAAQVSPEPLARVEKASDWATSALGSAMSVHQVPELIERLYAVVGELEELFPGRTPDGHLVGSIGEVLAAHYYDLTLKPTSYPDHDAVAVDGTLVQVKATQARQVGLRALPQHLLVLALHRDGSFTEVFNGPGRIAWDAAGPVQRNGQRPISVSRLSGLMDEVPGVDRLARQVDGEAIE